MIVMTIINAAILMYCIAITYLVIRINIELNRVDSDMNILLGKINQTLLSMRELDDKKMFEEDDEVGEVFRRLTDIVYTSLDVSEETHKLVENRPLESKEVW